MIETRQAGRRIIRLQSLEELEAELQHIEQAHAAGTLRHMGNWEPGTLVAHLAAWLEYGWKGYPPEVRAPLPVRLLLRLVRARMLRSPLPAGFRLPRVPGGTTGAEPMEFAAGIARYRKAWEPLRRGEAPPVPSPAFGRMTARECTMFHLRHAELHLGYLRY